MGASSHFGFRSRHIFRVCMVLQGFDSKTVCSQELSVIGIYTCREMTQAYSDSIPCQALEMALNGKIQAGVHLDGKRRRKQNPGLKSVLCCNQALVVWASCSFICLLARSCTSTFLMYDSCFRCFQNNSITSDSASSGSGKGMRRRCSGSFDVSGKHHRRGYDYVCPGSSVYMLLFSFFPRYH